METRLADFVAEWRTAIVARWADEVERRFGRPLSRADLVDGVPALLDDLVGELRRLTSGGAPDAAPHAAAHGRQRFRVGADVVQLIREQGVLRDVILAAARAAGADPSPHELAVLLEALDATSAQAVADFSAERDAALRAAEARMQALADRAPAAVFVMDARGRYAFVNAHMAHLLGRSREEVLGRTNDELLDADTAARLRAAHLRVLAGEVLETEDVVRRFDPPRYYTTVKFRLEDERGEPAVGCVSLEISERKRAEAEALHAAELLELGDAFFELDSSWRIVRVNAGQERLSAKPRRDTVGRTFDEVWPELSAPDDPFRREYERVMRERVPRDFEAHYAPLDLWTHVTAYPVSGGGVAVFFRDISRRKRAERDRDHGREFERQIMGIVSHDLRNPLSTVLMGARVLLGRGSLDDRDTATVARILAASERAARLVTDVLDFAQARVGGGIALRCRATDLAEVARGAVDELSAVFPDRQVEVRAPDGLSADLDPDRMAQVVSNLVTNALKYSPKDTPVRVAVEARGAEAVLTVHNRGDPIDPGLAERVFEPFRRAGAEAARTDAPLRSVGLGLFIVRHIVEAHHGRVEVTSTAERGTTFTVRLPLTGGCAQTPAPVRAGGAVPQRA